MPDQYFDRFLPNINTPDNCALSTIGTPGSTSYTYQVSAYTWGGETLASTNLTDTSGNSALSITNYNHVEWDVVEGAFGYCVYGRINDVTYGLLLKAQSSDLIIVSPTRVAYNDQGQHTPDHSTVPVLTNTTGRQNWDSVLFRDSKALQSAELNEIQSIQDYYLGNLGQYLFKEGYVVQGCTPVIQVANTIIIESGRIFIKNKVREIEGSTVSITGVGKEVIGLQVTELNVTQTDDPSLNDPATGAYNYNREGAHRRVYTFTWVVDDPQAVKVYDVQNGGVIVASQQTADSQIGKLLATRTYEQSGNFVVEPTSVVVKVHDTDDTLLLLNVSQMRAYVYGFRIERAKGTSLLVDKARDFKNVPEEQFTKSGSSAIYDLSETFVKKVNTCFATVRVTGETVTRGAVGGGKDELYLTPVVTILDVHQGGTTYTDGVDYTRDGNYVDWALPGSEPSVGTSYTVTYTYRKEMIKSSRVHTFVDSEPIVRGAGATDDLAHGDIIVVTNVSDTAHTSTSDYAYQTDYYFDDGQEDLAINAGNINWSPPSTHQPTISNTYYVSYWYWNHATEGEFTAADSYDSYIDIGSYGDYNLRDCVDFRCTGGVTPEPDNVNVDYDYYLPRKDLVCVSTNGDLTIVKGVSDSNPQAPAAPDQSMAIFELQLAPYTYGPVNVMKIAREVLRSTMADIKTLEKRVNTLEYFNTLSSLDKEAESFYTSALKSGVVTDSFVGSSRGDIFFNRGGFSFKAAFDTKGQCIQAQTPFVNQDLGSIIDLPNSSVTIGSKVISLPFTTVIEAQQPVASQVVNVNPYDVFSWNGELILTPESDSWVDTTRAPDLKVASGPTSEEMSMWTSSKGWDIQSSAWQEIQGTRNITVQGNVPVGPDSGLVFNAGGYNWGNADPAFVNKPWSTDRADVTTNAYSAERQVTNLNFKPVTETKQMGDAIIDTTIAPFVRSRWVDLEGHKLRPSTELTLNIDDKEIALVPVSPTTGSGGKVNTDAAGHFKARFLIPPGTFNVGNHEIKVYNSLPSSETSATVIYNAFGLQETRQQSYISLTQLQPKLTVNTETQAFQSQTLTATHPSWYDPIAETLLFTQSMFMKKVGLFFKTKDPTVPITIALRTVENGYPGQHTIVSKTIYPADILLSEDASVETIVEFDDIAFIEANKEICICLIANSTNYNVWIATMGANDITTGQLITKQPYNGVLFKSPNASTWVADANSDLKFNIYRANFSLSGSLLFYRILGADSTILSLNVTEFNPGDANIVLCGTSWQVDEVPVVDSSPLLRNGENVFLKSTYADIYVRTLIGTNNSRFSPTLNIERINMVMAKYNVDVTSGANAYISRVCDLSPNDFDSIKVILDIANYSGTQVDVYYSTDDGYTWVQFNSGDIESTSALTSEYNEYIWAVTLGASESKLRVRVDLKTNNPATTPKCRRLRAMTY